MKYGIISDIHSNIQALKQALKDLDGQVDEIVCNGDIVGYNANPRECIDLVKDNGKITHIIQGNHDIDAACFNDLSMDQLRSLSSDAYVGIKYSSSLLLDEDRDWLKSLPLDFKVKDKDFPFWISHYSPNQCTYFGYILYLHDARDSFKMLKEWEGSNVFFFGHSHIPSFIEMDEDGSISFQTGNDVIDVDFEIKDNHYYLINPGSIGQPRVMGLTSYAIFDTKEKTLVIKELEYNIEEAQKAINDAGYSQSIARRLSYDVESKKRAKKERCKQRQKQRNLDSQKKI